MYVSIALVFFCIPRIGITIVVIIIIVIMLLYVKRAIQKVTSGELLTKQAMRKCMYIYIYIYTYKKYVHT
jgi:hypothetical protein